MCPAYVLCVQIVTPVDSLWLYLQSNNYAMYHALYGA